MSQEIPPSSPGTSRRASLRALALAVLPAALPLVAAWTGSPGPRAVELNLGPGDGPFVHGFAPTWEIGDDRSAHHWTKREARIDLPLSATGRLSLLYRFAPPPGGGHVETSFAGRVDRFPAEEGRWDERRAPAEARLATPLVVGLRVDGPDVRDLGLRLDWLRIEVEPGGRLWLRGQAVARPAVLVAAVGLLLVVAGWSAWGALLVTLPLSIAAAAGLRLDPWLTHRLLQGVPEILLAAGVLAAGLGFVLRRRAWASVSDVRLLAGLFVAATLFRLVPLNHPAFFHPDLRTHARIASLVRETGPRFFLDPYEGLWRPAGGGDRVASGMWIKNFGDERMGLPYAVAFHSALALLDLDEDDSVTAVRLAGGALAACAPLLVFLLARALAFSYEAAALGAALDVFVPSVSAELANAAVPACLGHLCDLGFLIWLATALRSSAEAGRPWPWSTLLRGACGLAACYLVYTSSLVVSTLLLAALVLVSWSGPLRSVTRGLVLVLAMGAGLAIALYYWAFVAAAARSLAAIAGGGTLASAAAPVRTFGSVWPALLTWAAPLGALGTAFGLSRLLARPGTVRTFFTAALLTLGVVALARLAAPQVFGWVHEALFAGPLACLAIAASLLALRDAGRLGRWAAALLAAALALGGLAQYARLLADQSSRAL